MGSATSRKPNSQRANGFKAGCKHGECNKWKAYFTV